ncbi:MAG: hypothetical protein R2851_05470 [Caldilineaceae bacterium]
MDHATYDEPTTCGATAKFYGPGWGPIQLFDAYPTQGDHPYESHDDYAVVKLALDVAVIGRSRMSPGVSTWAHSAPTMILWFRSIM